MVAVEAAEVAVVVVAANNLVLVITVKKEMQVEAKEERARVETWAEASVPVEVEEEATAVHLCPMAAAEEGCATLTPVKMTVPGKRPAGRSTQWVTPAWYDDEVMKV